MKRSFAVATLVVLAAAVGPVQAAPAAETRSCRPVVDPYAGTRYEGTDLSDVRATGVSCATARRVARGAHRKALGLTPPAGGIRRFTWRGWRVRGDLRGATDRYTAVRGDKRVRWRF